MVGVGRIDRIDRNELLGDARIDEDVDEGVLTNLRPDRSTYVHGVDTADDGSAQGLAVPHASDRLDLHSALVRDDVRKRLDLPATEVADTEGAHADVVRGDVVGVIDGEVRNSDLCQHLHHLTPHRSGSQDRHRPGELGIEELVLLVEVQVLFSGEFRTHHVPPS